jgi:hypothetical protein
MSGNINDTKINVIKNNVDSLLNDLSNVNNITSEFKEILIEKYHYLYSTSKGLFELVIKEKSNPGFNKVLFDKNLDLMLNQINKIQNAEITQYKASQVVGTVIGNQYIPEHLRK